MSSADRYSSPLPDVRFRQAGSGHFSAWRCDVCQLPKPMLGRRVLRRGVMRIYGCAECAAKSTKEAA